MMTELNYGLQASVTGAGTIPSLPLDLDSINMWYSLGPPHSAIFRIDGNLKDKDSAYTISILLTTCAGAGWTCKLIFGQAMGWLTKESARPYPKGNKMEWNKMWNWIKSQLFCAIRGDFDTKTR